MSDSSPSTSPSPLDEARQRHRAALDAERAAADRVRNARLAREGLDRDPLSLASGNAYDRAVCELDRALAAAANRANFAIKVREKTAELLAQEEAKLRLAEDERLADEAVQAADELRAAVAQAADVLAPVIARVRSVSFERGQLAEEMREAGEVPAALPVESFASVASGLLSGDCFAVAARVVEWLGGEAGRASARAEQQRREEREQHEADLRGARGEEAQHAAVKRDREELAAWYGGSANHAVVAQLQAGFEAARRDYNPFKPVEA